MDTEQRIGWAISFILRNQKENFKFLQIKKNGNTT
jgi:hypothetical protein